MATADASVVAAVRRKLNVTWEDEGTDARVADVIAAVSPSLALRCGMDPTHAFSEGEPEWPLFLNACLYEWSDALDDFWRNYAEEIAAAHLRNFVAALDAAADATTDDEG